MLHLVIRYASGAAVCEGGLVLYERVVSQLIVSVGYGVSESEPDAIDVGGYCGDYPIKTEGVGIAVNQNRVSYCESNVAEISASDENPCSTSVC